MIKNRCDFLEAENQQNLHQRIAEIREKIEIAALKSGRSKDEITLMAVTKTVPPERVNEALKAGISLLGENRVQEFNEKEQFYQCKREKIHFIGHLQTNKIRDIIEKVGMIQSVDSIHLARAISKECEKRQSEMDILLQVNIGKEDSKSGFLEQEILESAFQIAELPRIHIKGLMAIPPRTTGDLFFRQMNELFGCLREKNIAHTAFTILSMGMSNDYEQAIHCGSTLVRLGKIIFGERE